jgi:hypothetical protein
MFFLRLIQIEVLLASKERNQIEPPYVMAF